MNNSIFVVTGRITREDTKKGVHGLLVEAWDEDLLFDDCLGNDLTNRDGSFTIHFREEDFQEPCEGNPEVYLKIRDCEGRLIYDTRPQTRKCQPAKPLVYKLSLKPDIFTTHLSCCGSWECIDEPLVPVKIIDEIEEAVSLIKAPAKPGHIARLKAILCARPPVDLFDKILRDAWDTLQGDLDAASRYRDILEALCACRAGECCVDKEGCYAQIIDDIFKDEWQLKPGKHGHTKFEAHLEKILHKPKHLEHNEKDQEVPCPCSESLIPNEKIMILVMAALHISCGHAKTAKTYLLALLDQICRFEFLGALHRSAVKALCGDQKSRTHFRDLLEFIGTKCQPYDGHFPPFPVRDPLPCCETCLDEKLENCMREAIRNWCRIYCYTITEVKPARACPGDEIVICGNHFGNTAGRIIFRKKGSLNPGPVANPENWSDDKITVVVPDDAGCGLAPELPADTVKVCDRFMEYHPTGCIKNGFEGTSAEILKFLVKGHFDDECLEPGEPLQIRWKTCAADKVKVEIINEDNGSVIAKLDPADDRGSWDFGGTNFTQTTHLKVQITAEGKCEPKVVIKDISFIFQKPANLTVDGMEVTQAVQYYKAAQHMTDPADRGPDNSLRLVTNKTAWVRVYLRSGQDPLFDNGQLPDVDGTLIVERRVNNIWSVVANIPSQNGAVTAEDSFVSYDDERRNINNSLNFVVSPNIMTGLLRFTVNVSSPFAECGGGNATSQTTVNVNLTQTLNAAFITIGYNGPNATNTGNLNLPAPNLAQCQAETSWAMTTFPVSGNANVRIAGTFITNTPLNDPIPGDGGCSPSWAPLLQQVANLIVADQAANPGSNWVYYGIISNGIPTLNSGCNWAASGGLVGGPITYAHEIGHQFGLPHSRCGRVGPGNPNYPVYQPYDLPVDPPGTSNWTMASLGEYGLDINNGNIANPNNAEDFMSYCGPPWISIFTHNFLVNQPRLVPQTIPTGKGGAADRVIKDDQPALVRRSERIEPLIHMLGVIDKEGKVAVSSVSRIDARYLIGNGRQTNYLAQLVDKKDRIISEDHLYRYASEGCKGENEGCCEDCQGEKSFMFKAFLNDYAPGACLRIVKDGEVVWQRDCPSRRPELTRVGASLDKKNNLKISWNCKMDSKAEEDVWIRWSNDDGKTWRALAVGLKGGSVTINPDNLPAGDIKLQLMANDGFYTITKNTDKVKLPPKPPVVSILYPNKTDKVYAERFLHLWGTATGFASGDISDDQFVWYIDEKKVGNGRDIWVDNPGKGQHKIRLEVKDKGGKSSAASLIKVV